MLPTVEFDDKAWRKAREMDDIISDRRLATKAEAKKLFVAQPLPEGLFGVGKLVAQLTRPT